MKNRSLDSNYLKVYTQLLWKNSVLLSVIGVFILASCSDSGTGSSTEDPGVSQIQLSINEAFIGIEDDLSPDVTVLDKDGLPMTGQQIEWSSDNSSIAEVSSSGLITGKSPGFATIEAKSEDKTATLSVEVFQGVGKSSHELAAIDRAVEEYLSLHSIPGASVAIVKDGRLVHVRGYGFADPETEKIADPETIFRYGSVSKPITSIATMMLLDDGVLSLDDKPFEMLGHLPVMPGKNEDPRLEMITLEQLLTHSGGWNPNRNVDNAVWQAISQFGVRDDSEMFRYGRSVELHSEPGTEYSYSNYATQTVGLLIEEITGSDYETWVRTNLFEPLDISTVKFGKTALADRESNEARYHRADGNRPDIDDGAMDYYGASGSWIGRAVDLVRLLNAIEGKGGLSPILQPQTIQTMIDRPDFYAETGNYYAKYWEVMPSANGDYWHHSGLADGSFADMWRMADGISYAILLNQSPSGPYPDLHSVLNDINDWPDTDYFLEFY